MIVAAMQDLQDQIELSMDLGRQTIEALSLLLEVLQGINYQKIDANTDNNELYRSVCAFVLRVMCVWKCWSGMPKVYIRYLSASRYYLCCTQLLPMPARAMVE